MQNIHSARTFQYTIFQSVGILTFGGLGVTFRHPVPPAAVPQGGDAFLRGAPHPTIPTSPIRQAYENKEIDAAANRAEAAIGSVRSCFCRNRTFVAIPPTLAGVTRLENDDASCAIVTDQNGSRTGTAPTMPRPAPRYVTADITATTTTQPR